MKTQAFGFNSQRRGLLHDETGHPLGPFCASCRWFGCCEIISSIFFLLFYFVYPSLANTVYCGGLKAYSKVRQTLFFWLVFWSDILHYNEELFHVPLIHLRETSIKVSEVIHNLQKMLLYTNARENVFPLCHTALPESTWWVTDISLKPSTQGNWVDQENIQESTLMCPRVFVSLLR